MKIYLLVISIPLCLSINSIGEQKVFDQLDRQYSTILPISERLNYWSSYFLDRPYSSIGPLGEGHSGKWDKDPLYRFDTFDCTTFVETTLALAHSSNQQSFETILNKLRYSEGQVDYFHRNHIITYAWLPNALQNNFLSVVSNAKWLFTRKSTSTTFKYGNWLYERLRIENAHNNSIEFSRPTLELLYPPIDIESDYLDINLILQNWDLFEREFDDFYLFNVVRPNWHIEDSIGTDLLVSHQGWVYRDRSSNEIVLIHASSIGKVSKITLKEYLSSYSQSTSIQGIQLFGIQQY